MASYQALEAWRVAHQLALEVTRVSLRLPAHERYELAAQLRRAALSVPTNLVEGRARFGSREYLKFVRIARASLAEVDYLLFFAAEMGYLAPDDHRRLDAMRRRANVLIAGLARSLERSTA